MVIQLINDVTSISKILVDNEMFQNFVDTQRMAIE